MQTHPVSQLFPQHTTGAIQNGVVQGGGTDGFIIQCEQGLINANRAFSCVIRPEVDDRVMLASDEQGRHFILAVLDRPDSSQAVVEFPDDTTITSRQGKLSLASPAGIDLLSPDAVAITAGEVNMAAGKGQLNIDKLNATGSDAAIHVNRIMVQADSVDTVAGRLTQRVKQCFRWIEQIEQVKAGEMIHSIKRLLSLRSRQAMITAKEDVKIDGERIHMG